MDLEDFKQIMNNIKTNVYVTDVDTYEILFMNQRMKEYYNLSNPEGKICWQVLKTDQTEPCSFCPVCKLKENNKLYDEITWRESSDKINGILENYDCLINWEDGKVAHMQQSINMTNVEELTNQSGKDDLTGILNRRAGKQKLNEFMVEKRKRNEDFTIALIDIDNLKKVNDNFGHYEGDRLIKKIVVALRQMMDKDDILFRLGGDEFILAFRHKSFKEANKVLLDNQKYTKLLRGIYDKPYDFSYSFGIYNVLATNTLTVNDVIVKADEQMYKEKLRYFRTKVNETKDELVFSNNNYANFKYDSSQLYEALIKSTDDFIYVCNMKTGFYRYSPAQVKKFNLPGEVFNNPLPIWKEIVHPQDWNRFYKSNMEIVENKTDYHSVEFRAKNSDGEYIWLRCRGRVTRDEFGEPSLFAGIMTQMDRQNKIDSLTHLYNRQELAKSFNYKVKDSAIDNLGIMIIDVDDFKNVNQIYDRSFGDFIIKVVSILIQSVIPGNASIYKLDGDQLGILIENTNEEEIASLYDEIQKQLLQEQILQRYKCLIQVSAGCSFYPRDGYSYSELYKYADYSLQYAKENGKNRLIFFSNDILEHKMRSLEILKYIRESVSDNYRGFELFYQPQVDADTKTIKGVESLLRWHCDQLGVVSPSEFVPILEENGLVVQVGLWVIKEAMQAWAKWVEDHPDFMISINVSALQLLNSDFVDDVKEIFKDNILSPQNIILELTESYMFRNMDLLRKIFDQLQTLGFKIAIDDFGTGYASLEVLKTTSANIVKIDQTFVKGIMDSKFDQTFIRFITQMCHDVDIKVLLEGVETEEEYDLVRPMELDYIQGYLFGKPQKSTEIIKILTDK